MQRVSTEDVAERERLAFIHDFIARHWAGMNFTLLDETDLRIDMAVFDLPDRVGIGLAHYPPIVTTRPRNLLSDGRDNYTVAILSEDHEVSVEGGRAFTVKAGDMMLVHEATWFEVRHQRAKVEVVSLGCAQVAARVPRFDLAPCYHIPGNAPGAALFAGYANLLRQAPPVGERARQTAANHIHDLMAVCLDGFVRGGAERNERSVRAARLELIQKDILDRLRDPSLDVNAVARRQGVTPRYIQRLFGTKGTTFTEFVRDNRLALALRRLGEDDSGISIADIAFESGFADLSNFNRAFRRRYGVTPSDIRAEAMRKRIR
jgi:AraC-like DNA-binding protein